MEKVGNSLNEYLAKPGYKSKHESTKRSAWLEWCSHGLPTSYISFSGFGVISYSLSLANLPALPSNKDGTNSSLPFVIFFFLQTEGLLMSPMSVAIFGAWFAFT